MGEKKKAYSSAPLCGMRVRLFQPLTAMNDDLAVAVYAYPLHLHVFLTPRLFFLFLMVVQSKWR